MSYPEIITRLPLANVPFPGVNGYMLRSTDGLQVFFHFTQETIVPMHSHGAQWGIVVAGQMTFSIGDETRVYKAGDTYAIQRGQLHGGTISAGTRLIDFFEEADRYSVRPFGG